MLIETLVAQPADEAIDEAVSHIGLTGSRQYCQRRPCRPVCRPSDTVRSPGNPNAEKRIVDHRGQALAGEVVDDAQDDYLVLLFSINNNKSHATSDTSAALRIIARISQDALIPFASD